MTKEWVPTDAWRYTVILQPEPEEGGYSVTVPFLPGCQTQGESLEEAIAMAKEAIELHLEGLIARGESLPQETEHPQAITLSGSIPQIATSTH